MIQIIAFAVAVVALIMFLWACQPKQRKPKCGGRRYAAPVRRSCGMSNMSNMSNAEDYESIPRHGRTYVGVDSDITKNLWQGERSHSNNAYVESFTDKIAGIRLPVDRKDLAARSVAYLAARR
jgi:hypothetical protein